MIVCAGYIGLVILIEAGPVYNIFMADIRGKTLSPAIWLWIIGSFGTAFVFSLAAIALPMRFGENRLSKRLI
jgi:ABC-2 type transport system permease protein